MVIKTTKPKYSVMEYVIYLLSRRDHSVFELMQKCKQKGYEEQESEQAIKRAQELNYQSDQKFCSVFIRSKSQSGYGPNKIIQELKYKGVNEKLIHLTLEESEIDWFAIAQRVFEKKKPTDFEQLKNNTSGQNFDDTCEYYQKSNRFQQKNKYLKAKQKLYRFMISRGFSPNQFDYLFVE